MPDSERLARVEVNLENLMIGQKDGRARSHEFANALQAMQFQQKNCSDKIDDIFDYIKESRREQKALNDRVENLEDESAARRFREKERAEKWSRRKKTAGKGAAVFGTAIITGAFSGDQISRLLAWLGSFHK